MPINAVGIKIIAPQSEIHEEKLNAYLVLPCKEHCDIFITRVQREMKFRLKDAEEKKNIIRAQSDLLFPSAYV